MTNDHTMNQVRKGPMFGLRKNERVITKQAIFNRGRGMIYDPLRMDM